MKVSVIRALLFLLAFFSLQLFGEGALLPRRPCSLDCGELCQARGRSGGRCTSAGGCACLIVLDE